MAESSYAKLPDADLVRAALERLPENNYRAAELLGLTEGTVRNLRRREEGELRAATRSALLAFLDRGGQGASEVLEGDGEEVQLFEQLRAIIEDGAMSAVHKILLVDAVRGAWSSAVLYRGEVAAGIRASALLEGEVGGRVRAEVVGRVAESASTRALALSEVEGATGLSEEELERRLAMARRLHETAVAEKRSTEGGSRRAAG